MCSKDVHFPIRRERTSWFPKIFQEENLNLILNSPLIINDTMKINNQIASVQEQKTKLIGIFTYGPITENDMKKAMCYPLIVQRLNNQVICKGYSFVCNDDELLFFELESSRWSHDRAYAQRCAMADVIKLDSIHGICYFYSLIHTLANKLKYPFALEVFRYGPIFSKVFERNWEKRKKLMAKQQQTIPKIEKQYKMVVLVIPTNVSRKALKDVTNLTKRLNQLHITK